MIYGPTSPPKLALSSKQGRRFIALDAMGGDYAPDQIVLGALQAAKNRNIYIKLFGREQEIVSLLEQHGPGWEKYNITIEHCSQEIGMAEEPVSAVRKKKDSSLVKAVLSVKLGQCRAVVSAGNSGALMVAANFILGRNQGVERPAIIGLLPTGKKTVFCLDLGANADCKPEHLYQFAHMASSYAKKVFNLSAAKVALLSNGREEGKGCALVKRAFSLLKESDLNFVGNIEPDGIFDNQADIVVCDGFSGNILLKAIETTEKVFGIKGGWLEPGGALLLGVNGTVIVAHGNSNAVAIENSILFAFKNLKEERVHGVFKKSINRAVT